MKKIDGNQSELKKNIDCFNTWEIKGTWIDLVEEMEEGEWMEMGGSSIRAQRGFDSWRSGQAKNGAFDDVA